MHSCVTAESALTMKIVLPFGLIFPSRRLATNLPRRQLLQQPVPRRGPGAQLLSTLPPGTALPSTARRSNSETPAIVGSSCPRLQTAICAERDFLVSPAHDKDPDRPNAAFSNRR